MRVRRGESVGEVVVGEGGFGGRGTLEERKRMKAEKESPKRRGGVAIPHIDSLESLNTSSSISSNYSRTMGMMCKQTSIVFSFYSFLFSP